MTLEERAAELTKEFDKAKSDYEKLMLAKQQMEANMVNLQGRFALVQELIKEKESPVTPTAAAL